MRTFDWSKKRFEQRKHEGLGKARTSDLACLVARSAVVELRSSEFRAGGVTSRHWTARRNLYHRKRALRCYHLASYDRCIGPSTEEYSELVLL